jgi:hypothetical protein
LRFDRSSHRYCAIRNDQAVLRGRIRELAAARLRYGYLRIYIDVKRIHGHGGKTRVLFTRRTTFNTYLAAEAPHRERHSQPL